MHRQPPSVDILASSSSFSSSRPTTREGPEPPSTTPPPPPPPLTQSHSTTSITGIASGAGAAKDRKPSFSRKPASFSAPRRRGNSATSNTSGAVVTDATIPPALPDYALSAAAKVAPRDRDADPVQSPASPDSFGRMLSRTTTSNSSGMPPPPTPVGGSNGGSFWQPTDAGVVHQQITELANKRIATLDYLRRAHAGRVYWFNSYLLDKTDLGRMPCFDPRRLSRKATNYLLLGISLPVLIDMYSSAPLEFLRSFSTLLSEFDSFQQLRSDSASLTRARLPNMFRRQGTKSRRSTSTADATVEEAAAAMPAAGGGAVGGLSPGTTAPSVMNFAASESDLLPGEEYAYLLTPSLPFEPDYFETFATLCDALIDCYTRFLALVPTPRECSASVAEHFTKADARVRKILVQGIIKEFEDSSRANVKTEVASIGKVVLGGLM